MLVSEKNSIKCCLSSKFFDHLLFVALVLCGSIIYLYDIYTVSKNTTLL